MTADVHQFVRCAVGDFVLRDNRIGDILLDVVKRREALRQFLQNRRVVALGVQRLPRRAGGLHQRRHFQQRLRGERRALFRQRQTCAHVRKRHERRRAHILQDDRRFLRLRLHPLDFGYIAGRNQRLAALPPHVRHGLACQTVADFGKFQHPQGSFLHHLRVPHKSFILFSDENEPRCAANFSFRLTRMKRSVAALR